MSEGTPTITTEVQQDKPEAVPDTSAQALGRIATGEVAPPTAQEAENPWFQAGQLASGETVWDQANSHTHDRGELLAEALSKVDAQGKDFLVEQVHFDRIIGETTCVETTDEDEIIWAFRTGRKGPTRFVVGRQAEPTTEFTAIARRLKKDPTRMAMVTGWVGSKSAPEPWDKHSDEASDEFWGSHALIWGSEPIDEDRGVFKMGVSDVSRRTQDTAEKWVRTQGPEVSA